MNATNVTLGLSIMAVVGALLACGGTQEQPACAPQPYPDLATMGVEQLPAAAPADAPAEPAAR